MPIILTAMFFSDPVLTEETTQTNYLQEQIAGGDSAAFKQLYYQYRKDVYALAFTYTRCAPATEDIVQEVFLRLWLKRETLSGVKKIRHYLLVTTRNYIVSSLRRKGLPVTALEEWVYNGLADQHLGADNLFAAQQSEHMLRRLTGLLSPKQQEAFFLSREQGLSRNEIACQLGISPSTVKNHIHAAISILKDQLQKEDAMAGYYS